MWILTHWNGNCWRKTGDCVSNNHNKKRYMIYDGDVLVGTYTGAEAGELFGVHKYSIGKYAYSGDLLNGRYTVKREEDVIEREKVIRKWDFREGWDAEWETATAVIREEIEVEKLIWESWNEAVRPFRRRSWMWKEKRC